MNKPVTFSFGGTPERHITVASGTLDSNLGDIPGLAMTHPYRCAVDGIESLLLAMATAGIDLDTPEMREAVETAHDAVDNYLG